MKIQNTIGALGGWRKNCAADGLCPVIDKSRVTARLVFTPKPADGALCGTPSRLAVIPHFFYLPSLTVTTEKIHR
jgi:hypothetical protein